MVELLSPVGDFECLKAAVQNGADAVYFGANLFSARAFATNFNETDLEQAINYAKLRGVKTHLTLNTLIKNNEFEDAFNLAKKAYELGIDAIIVQDLGLATNLIKSFPDLDIHASTQMTTTNLEGIKQLEKIGFKRAVLSREVSLPEIAHICKNSNIEIETFIHGALCISYSGECLFSSMIGGRSGNRGKCAQPCRLPYTLLDENRQSLDKGYLLSTRDLCSLEYLPDLIKAGVASFKIEGRMKSPTYVATVTRIYRKYIDLAIKFNNHEIENYVIDEKDKKNLLQVFNRGGFSTGHLLSTHNKNLVFKEKPNNMGIYLGKIIKYNPNKGLITVKLANDISIGDSISFENENSTYTISELMLNNQNIKNATDSQIVTLGRMKGNINIHDKIYKIKDKELSTLSLNSFSKEYKKTYLICKLDIHSGQTIKINVKSTKFNLEVNFVYDYIPQIAENATITPQRIIEQFSKTLNTCFEFSNIEINLDDNLFIPISTLNDIRRKTLSLMENKIIDSFKRKSFAQINLQFNKSEITNSAVPKKALLLNILNPSFEYSTLNKVDNIYIPLKYFYDKKFEKILNTLSEKSKLYIYLPIVVKDAYISTITQTINNAFNNFDISGVVVSNLSELNILNRKVDLVANYTFNLYNSYTAHELENLELSTVTISPELDTSELCNISAKNREIIVYGKIPLMTMNYCLLGKSNKCFNNCSHQCLSLNNFFIKDRFGFNFRVVPDNLQTITTIYNSRNLSIDSYNLDINSIRIDILDESIEEINAILETFSK